MTERRQEEREGFGREIQRGGVEWRVEVTREEERRTWKGGKEESVA